MAENGQQSQGRSGADGASPPEGYDLVYNGQPLPPFYAAEILRPLIGRTVWIRDAGGHTRHGQIKDVPWLKEDQQRDVPPVVFEDDRPFYLKQIVCVAVYAGDKCKDAS
ncbi:MAG TPA: hypothetical protein VNA25_13350 [Phycisphaerae bacterium]|nr:hypothetical protein [Phycisphaerae bacterium]